MIAAFDLDGTLLTKNCSFAFCKYLSKIGFFSKTDLFFCAGSYFRYSFLGLSLFDLHTLVFNRLFRGQAVPNLSAFVEQFVHEMLAHLWYLPALSRLRKLQSLGVECMILSSSPIFLVEAVSKTIGIKKIFATTYQCNASNELTGITQIMDGRCKAELLRSFHSISTIAFSDSLEDLAFLQAAHVAVAVNPGRALKKIAQAKGWELL